MSGQFLSPTSAVANPVRIHTLRPGALLQEFRRSTAQIEPTCRCTFRILRYVEDGGSMAEVECVEAHHCAFNDRVGQRLYWAKNKLVVPLSLSDALNRIEP